MSRTATLAMDEVTGKALQIVAIQHELAMAIGLSLDLQTMLDQFMEAAVRRLNLRSIHVYQTEDNKLAWPERSAEGVALLASIPRLFDGQTEMQNLRYMSGRWEPNSPASAYMEIDGLHYLAYRLKGVGFVVLVKRGRAIDPGIACSLEPVFERLSGSCRSCIEHEQLLVEVAARKQAEKALLRQAAHDVLTDLPNRKTLNQQLCQAVSAAYRKRLVGAVFFIDLDKFKQVNDTRGHAAGDALLRHVAERLRLCARSEDIVARIGGDEFVLVVANLALEGGSPVAAAQRIAARLEAALSTPAVIDSQAQDVSVSLGIALFPNDIPSHCEDATQRCDTLLRYADSAMYRAKTHGQSAYEFFSVDMQHAADRRLSLEMHLGNAIERNELAIYLQPIFNADKTVISAESLLRWHSPVLGAVSPSEFIPVAEESKLILQIGEWVLEQVCCLLARGESKLASLEHISVNVSARQLRQSDFVDKVLALVEKYQVPKGSLQLEITETATLDDLENTASKMQRLAACGVHFSLDDFGTGYSSLSYVHRLPLSTLKLDRSFVHGVAGNIEHQAIVEAAIAMADKLSIRCIAEGVEQKRDFDYLLQHDVYAYQGYFYSRPVSVEDFIKHL